jgi:hypothetical protein
LHDALAKLYGHNPKVFIDNALDMPDTLANHLICYGIVLKFEQSNFTKLFNVVQYSTGSE